MLVHRIGKVGVFDCRDIEKKWLREEVGWLEFGEFIRTSGFLFLFFLFYIFFWEKGGILGRGRWSKSHLSFDVGDLASRFGIDGEVMLLQGWVFPGMLSGWLISVFCFSWFHIHIYIYVWRIFSSVILVMMIVMRERERERFGIELWICGKTWFENWLIWRFPRFLCTRLKN